MGNNVQYIVNTLKKIVDKNGLSYLNEKPYQVYLELLNSGVADKILGSAILYVIASGILEGVDFDNKLVALIEDKCCLNEEMANRVALIFIMLFSEKNRKEWKKKEKVGLELFLKENFVLPWEGFEVWNTGHVSMYCHYQAQIELRPTKLIEKDEELAKQLESNPFLTKETIYDYFSEQLVEFLNQNFNITSPRILLSSIGRQMNWGVFISS